ARPSGHTSNGTSGAAGDPLPHAFSTLRMRPPAAASASRAIGAPPVNDAQVVNLRATIDNALHWPLTIAAQRKARETRQRRGEHGEGSEAHGPRSRPPGPPRPR